MDIKKNIDDAKMRILKNELCNYRNYEKLEKSYVLQLNNLNEKLEEIGDVQGIKYDTMHSQNPVSTDTKYNNVLSDIQEKEAEINQNRSKMKKIESVINRVDDDESRDIMTKKYINHYSWKKLGKEYTYSIHALTNKVDRALIRIVGD